MKLTTSIQPRRDGTVTATAPGGDKFVFKAGPSGDLECDVADEAAIAALLQTGNFYPADEADFEQALSVIKPVGEGGEDADAKTQGETLPASLTAPAPRRGKSRAA